MFTYHSTAHIAVIRLCTNDAEIFLHFHAFLPALSGMGTLLIPVLTSLKNPTEHPVVKTTELNSIAEKCMKNRKNSQVTAASLSAAINKPWNYLIPIERIRILNAMNPSDLGFTCCRRRRKITFACVPQMICTHSLVKRDYCLWRKAWTSRFSADRDFLAFSCCEDHVSQENRRHRRWSRSACVSAVMVCVEPWQVVKPKCCKTLACVTFWHRRKTAPPLPTTKGRGQIHAFHALRCVQVLLKIPPFKLLNC